MTGNGRRIEAVVLSAIAALIVLLCSLVLVSPHRHQFLILEAIGIPTVPRKDLRLANRRLQPPDIQQAFGSPENYPDEARDQGQQGSVRTTLSIAATGVVENCRIKSSSKSASLDAATCRLARKLRFDPARGHDGEAIASSYVLAVRWVLPES